MRNLYWRIRIHWASFWRVHPIQFQKCPICGLQRGRFTATHGGPFCVLPKRQIGG